MAFQDNSGDIIFDVVLTDEGRRRLAKGDGRSFRIIKFALSDEEINYELFDKSKATAFQDLSILQTPILEAFTNNTSTMKTKLVSVPRNDLLYLPVIKLNEGEVSRKMHGSGSFMIAVDGNTEDNNGVSTTGTAIGISNTTNAPVQGIIFGQTIRKETTYCRVDAGLDTDAVPPSVDIPASLAERGYTIEIDNRLGRVVSRKGDIVLSPASIDDDNIAMYVVTTADLKFVFQNTSTQTNATEAIAGSRSTYLEFKIASSANLRQSNFLFDKLGASTSMINVGGNLVSNNVKYIDTLVKVTGIQTGYSVDLPVRFIKLQ